MTQFHETRYGQKFFETQLPDLINALGRIADCMDRRDKLIKLVTQGNVGNGVTAGISTKYAGAYVHTVTEDDVGHDRIPWIGTEHYTSPCGTIQAQDVGKRIYKVNGTIQIENKAQFKRRLEG